MADITVKAGETLVLRSTVTFDLVNGTRTVTDQTWEVVPAPDPQPPTLREQVAAHICQAVKDASGLTHDAPEWDAEQADAVLAVVADWLAAQPVGTVGNSAAQRDHDVNLLRGGSDV